MEIISILHLAILEESFIFAMCSEVITFPERLRC